MRACLAVITTLLIAFCLVMLHRKYVENRRVVVPLSKDIIESFNVMGGVNDVRFGQIGSKNCNAQTTGQWVKVATFINKDVWQNHALTLEIYPANRATATSRQTFSVLVRNSDKDQDGVPIFVQQNFWGEGKPAFSTGILKRTFDPATPLNNTYDLFLQLGTDWGCGIPCVWYLKDFTGADTVAVEDSDQSASVTGGTQYSPKLIVAGPDTSAGDFKNGLSINDKTIKLRTAADGYHGLRYDAGVDGPALYGHTGGFLGTFDGTTTKPVVSWSQGGAKVAGDLDVSGTIMKNGVAVALGGSAAAAVPDMSGGNFAKGIVLNDKTITLRGSTDPNHGLKYDSATDGPILGGYTGGKLNAGTNFATEVLSWKPGAVGIKGDVTISGNINGAPYPPPAVAAAAANPNIVGTSLKVDGNGQITKNNVIEFGAGVAGKEVNAGKIAYGAFDGNSSLNIVGAGTTGSNRLVRVWDNLTVNGDSTVGGNIKLGGSGISTVDGTDWMRIYGTKNGTAMYGGVSINQGGGLNVGNWANVPQGQILTTSDVHVGGVLYADKICNNSGGGGQRCINLWDSTGGQGSATIQNGSGSKFAVQDDANTVLYNKAGKGIWATGTNGKN